MEGRCCLPERIFRWEDEKVGGYLELDGIGGERSRRGTDKFAVLVLYGYFTDLTSRCLAESNRGCD